MTPTTGSKVGIIYSTGKKHVRGHIYVDSDAEWPTIQANLPAGCSIVFVPMSSHIAGPNQFYTDLATAVGLPTMAQQFTDPRCVVIDNISNIVEKIIMADDSMDTMQGKTLINHQSAQVGDVYDPILKQFTRASVILPIKLPDRPIAITTTVQVFS